MIVSEALLVKRADEQSLLKCNESRRKKFGNSLVDEVVSKGKISEP